MPNHNQFRPSSLYDGSVIIIYGTIVYVSSNQDNSVSQVVDASTSQQNALQRRGLQRVRDGLMVIAKCMPAAVGFIYYLMMGGTPFV